MWRRLHSLLTAAAARAAAPPRLGAELNALRRQAGGAAYAKLVWLWFVGAQPHAAEEAAAALDVAAPPRTVLLALFALGCPPANPDAGDGAASARLLGHLVRRVWPQLLRQLESHEAIGAALVAHALFAAHSGANPAAAVRPVLREMVSLVASMLDEGTARPAPALAFAHAFLLLCAAHCPRALAAVGGSALPRAASTLLRSGYTPFALALLVESGEPRDADRAARLLAAHDAAARPPALSDPGLATALDREARRAANG